MTSTLIGDTWTRRGISLLWDSNKLTSITEIHDVISIRKYLSYSKTEWPDELVSSNGYAMIVSGLDTMMDILEPSMLKRWLENEFYQSLLSFQSMYEGQCSLIFWLPDAQKRLEFKTDGIYYWNCSGPYHGEQVPLSRCLWNGAATDAKMLTNTSNTHDIKDKNCLGIYHPRIS